MGVYHVLAFSSGTATIHIALLAAGVGPGDEVIVSPYSWGQSVVPVLFAGATALFADIHPKTLCLDLESVKKKNNRKHQSNPPVHVFGHNALWASY
ncbi:MAG: DegT/DnrJ/EryC1/StrS family aminotransferase, partial [Desulfobulbaceae bacterium]|nr:DegT/DnrJ/EryC1/StrS family aminotransferase [Desulfobulbaceae bacterium]